MTTPAAAGIPTTAIPVQAPAAVDTSPAAHRWIGLANIPLDEAEARHGVLRKSIRLADSRKTIVLEVICARCRRGHGAVAGRACEAVEDTTHLIGGNPGERAKRKRVAHDPALVSAGPSINRRGIAGYLSGEA